MTSEKIIDLAEAILESLSTQRNYSNSVYNLRSELNSDLYLIKTAVKELEKRSLVKVINASTQTNPGDALIELSDKGKYYINNFDELFEIEIQNMKSLILNKIQFLKQKILEGGLSLDQEFAAKEELKRLVEELEKVKEH